jgi:hypothetical protein
MMTLLWKEKKGRTKKGRERMPGHAPATGVVKRGKTRKPENPEGKETRKGKEKLEKFSRCALCALHCQTESLAMKRAQSLSPSVGKTSNTELSVKYRR